MPGGAHREWPGLAGDPPCTLHCPAPPARCHEFKSDAHRSHSHPLAAPLRGGTLFQIEGSNLAHRAVLVAAAVFVILVGELLLLLLLMRLHRAPYRLHTPGLQLIELTIREGVLGCETHCRGAAWPTRRAVKHAPSSPPCKSYQIGTKIATFRARHAVLKISPSSRGPAGEQCSVCSAGW